jgi:hypothetical protein
MNDDRLERLVRDADPYRPDLIDDLRGVEQELLEEIMSAPISFEKRRRFLMPLATAAAVVGVLAAGTLVLWNRQDAPSVALPTPSASASASGVSYAMALRAAEDSPRLLIDEPGWTAVSVYGFAQESGDVLFEKGDRSLNMTWYPATSYQSYYDDRLSVSPPRPAKAGDWAGDIFTYSENDFAIMLKPRDGVFTELRTTGAWTRTSFEALLPKIRRVDAKTWVAALPPEIVTPDRAAQAARQILADVPLPPGFDVNAQTDLGINDRYQFGAQVIGRVGCGWIAEGVRADEAGDRAAYKRVVEALSSSHQWQILVWMRDEGDWAEGFWEVADQIADGRSIANYRDAFDCG